MSEFEPCPVTGESPYWLGLGKGLEYRDPLTGEDAEKFIADHNTAVRWWHETYLPAARKYAEHLESQKPVEFQVGDEVGLNQAGIEWVAEYGHQIINANAVITKATDYNVEISPPFVRNTVIGKKYLRLISRPKKLTVADLPEIEGFHWQPGYVDQGCFIEMKPVPKNPQKCDPAMWKSSIFDTEHESVQAALDFLNKIWAAKPEGV